MPALRTPTAKARVTGAAAKNPQRHRDRVEPKATSFPTAPAHLTKDMQKAWALFAMELPWLTGSDAALVEVACTVRAQLLAGVIPGVTALSMYQSVLSKMGATPADRSKVQVPDDEPQADEFFGPN